MHTLFLEALNLQCCTHTGVRAVARTHTNTNTHKQRTSCVYAKPLPPVRPATTHDLCPPATTTHDLTSPGELPDDGDGDEILEGLLEDDGPGTSAGADASLAGHAYQLVLRARQLEAAVVLELPEQCPLVPPRASVVRLSHTGELPMAPSAAPA